MRGLPERMQYIARHNETNEITKIIAVQVAFFVQRKLPTIRDNVYFNTRSV